ncbi:MAG: PEP-CTERM sorting domain-containing protein [Mangrovicoccus sp.]|nr:PEP-CTERM sorting domain-containing protein [Mangrovicoccus sp.]
MFKSLLTAGAALFIATGANASTFAFSFSGTVAFLPSPTTTLQITDIAEITPGTTLGYGDYLLADTFTLPITLVAQPGSANLGESFTVDYSTNGDTIADGSLTFTLGETTTALVNPQFIALGADIEIVDSNGDVSFAEGEFLFSTQSGPLPTDSFSANISALQQFTPVPVPASGLLLGGVLLGFVFLRRQLRLPTLQLAMSQARPEPPSRN